MKDQKQPYPSIYHSLALLLVLGILTGTACRAQQRLLSSPSAARAEPGTGTYAEDPSSSATPQATAPAAIPTATTEPFLPTTVQVEAACSPSPVIARLLSETNADSWMDWIEKLSGAEEVTIGGEETRITTRYSPAMFSGQEHARAFEFVREQVEGWYPSGQVEVMDFTVHDPEGNPYTWKNLILTIPGASRADEIVILSAHLDSTSDQDPMTRAPGAEDNGSGSAALLEAARLLRPENGITFERTIRIIWFTGEEQGMQGSRAYADQVQDPDAIVGVINLDMFGYDSDDDRCFELHVGSLPASNQIGQCFVASMEAYVPDLEEYDYLTDQAIDRSDHGSFWAIDVGAIEVLQNMFDNDQPGGCSNGDMNPYYHTQRDTVARINPQTGIAIVRAALGTLANLAGPLE